MKQAGLLWIVLLAGSACAAPKAMTLPTAERVLQLFFQNMVLPLKEEPNCQQVSAAKPAQSLTLGDHFATNLSVSFNSKNTVSLKTSCDASQFEQPHGQLQPIWDCKIEILEQDAQGEFVSSSMTAFYLTADGSALLPGSLRCF